MDGYHVAQLNVSRPKYDLSDPRFFDFFQYVNRVNAAADRSPGFVWRHIDADAEPGYASVFPYPDVIANLSVWETVADLEDFVFKTVHKRVLVRGGEWFSAKAAGHSVMWRVAKGQLPTFGEAAARLEHLNMHGASEFAFDWDHARQMNANRQVI
ncbi:DUF3291 domain-containing protein [Roseibium sp. RKSG952]|uniref:DUF3291 domain-containing protein n=1 Tax=Roseibium sp. RKSG952 TaxID=2529384 RepID=UPI001AD8C3E9|nr:DUF3291 domain-containing protein [Roseibium sp. RKSG952]